MDFIGFSFHVTFHPFVLSFLVFGVLVIWFCAFDHLAQSVTDTNGWKLTVHGNRYYGYKIVDTTVNYTTVFGSCYYQTVALGKTPKDVKTVEITTVSVLNMGGTMGGCTPSSPSANFSSKDTSISVYAFSVASASNFATTFVLYCQGEYE